MGGLLLFEGEELIISFRPHPVAYLRRYASALAWLVPAAVAAYWPIWWPGARSIEWGLVAFIGLGLAAALVGRAMFGSSLSFTWFASLSAAGLVLARLMDWIPDGYPEWFLGTLLGGFVALTRVLLHEVDRVGRLHFLTTERLVIRGGLKSRRERTISLKKIQEVRSERPMFGRFFDFGNLNLIQSRTLRGKDAKIHEDIEVLPGIARLTEVQFNIQQLVEESRMPPKDRRKRLEERRVRDSMRRLSVWMRRDQGQRPQA